MATKKNKPRKKKKEPTYKALVTIKLRRPDGSDTFFERWCEFPTSFHAVQGNSFTACATKKFVYCPNIETVDGAPTYLPANIQQLEVHAILQPNNNTSKKELGNIETELRRLKWKSCKG